MAENTPSVQLDPENLTEPGDVITEELIITNDRGQSIDVKNFCFSLSLHEDMFSNVMMGEALFTDSANLIALLPLKGTEYITLSYRTPGFKERISKTFYIYKLSDRTFIGTDRQLGYVLSFISIEGHLDNITVISKKYSDSSDKVVRKIFSEYLTVKRNINKEGVTPFFVEGSASSKITFVPTFWTPLKAINWVASRTFTSGAEAPNFLFFESNKAFYFTSIEKLIKNQLDANTLFTDFVYYPGASNIQVNVDSRYKYVKPELGKQFNMVKSMKPFKMFDTLHGHDYGYYASTLVSFDTILKMPSTTQYDYYTGFNSFKHMEGSKARPVFSNNTVRNPATYKGLLTKQYKVHNDAVDPKYQKWALQRNSLLNDMNNIKIEIEVSGRTDIEIGKLVRFLYPKNIDKNPDILVQDALDPYFSGVYMITAIRHQFTLNKHIMHVELAKDSFAQELK